MHLFAASGPAAARFNGIGNSPTSHGKKLLCIMVLQLHMRAINKKNSYVYEWFLLAFAFLAVMLYRHQESQQACNNLAAAVLKIF